LRFCFCGATIFAEDVTDKKATAAMQIAATVNGKTYRIAAQGYDISLPVRFSAPQLTAFGAPPAAAAPYETDGFTGDVKSGGSCNCGVYSFSPHLHGTHTECVGHIAAGGLFITDIIKESFIPATLITLAAEKQENGDMLLTRTALEGALDGAKPDFLDALVIRTLPNNDDKRGRDYDGKTMPPYFTADAMAYILLSGVRHLLVDLPSIDRMDDGGKLENHRIFWNVPDGVREISPALVSENTVTELIYVPDNIKDGYYFLNLQVAAFAADAAPSRPVLYEVTT